MLIRSLEIDPEDLRAQTGWEIKPEGACKGDVCVPLKAGVERDGFVDAEGLASALGMALVRASDDDLWALGPESLGKALTTAVLPSIELPDADGDLFALDSLKGNKVLLIAWASW